MENKMYKAYIAANKYTKAFDSEMRESKQSALRVLKTRNYPDYKDCHIWVVKIINGQEFTI